MKQFKLNLAAVLIAITATLSANAQNVTVGGEPMLPKKDIIDNAVNSKAHTTLVAAVKAADLVATLKTAGPFTVFAPTNAAFEKLPKGKTIVFNCSAGARSIEAWSKLKKDQVDVSDILYFDANVTCEGENCKIEVNEPLGA